MTAVFAATSQLPQTGVAVTGVLIGGAILVGGGIALSIMARKRREQAAAGGKTESSGDTPSEK